MKRRIPFAMSWWALTFPTGALAVASGITHAATGLVFVGSFYRFVAAFLVVIWLVVFLRTLAGVVTRRVFLPAH